MTPVISKGFSKYLRVPYLNMGRDMLGWDCYGLCRFLLAERLGLLVPSYADAYTDAERDACAALAGRHGAGWRPIPQGDEREGDVVVFNVGGSPTHCGYVIERGIMLHALRGVGTAIESYTGRVWCKRVEGIYRCKL